MKYSCQKYVTLVQNLKSLHWVMGRCKLFKALSNCRRACLVLPIPSPFKLHLKQRDADFHQKLEYSLLQNSLNILWLMWNIIYLCHDLIKMMRFLKYISKCHQGIEPSKFFMSFTLWLDVLFEFIFIQKHKK